jgi:hypothetical protein
MKRFIPPSVAGPGVEPGHLARIAAHRVCSQGRMRLPVVPSASPQNKKKQRQDSAKRSCSTTELRSFDRRDSNPRHRALKAVVPPAFAAKNSATRMARRRPRQRTGAGSRTLVKPDVVLPAFAQQLSSPFGDKRSMRGRTWLDVLASAFAERRRSISSDRAPRAKARGTLSPSTQIEVSSITPTQWSAPRPPAAYTASSLNTSSLKPPMFSTSSRSCAWVVA